ncbi:EthD domain-containing protein [Sphingomonas paeninsulae]|nr:EthD domain-containing protein [Sphingomonas paeninsulae]
MIKVIWLLKRKPGMSKEAFREHYESSHVMLAHQYVGHLLEGYHRNYPVEGWLAPSSKREDGVVEPFEYEYDCITEMRIKDEAAADEMLQIFNDPVIGKIFVDDEHRFLDRKKVVMLTCDEVNNGTGTGPLAPSKEELAARAPVLAH